MTHITKLDLSKNELKELPEDFGKLTKLKHLDLYQNQLQHLPLSFSKLKDLRFLDLKGNPLVPTVAKVAGPCLDTKQCQSCARDIVNFFVKLEQQVNAELENRNKTRQKQLEINQQKKQEEKKSKKKEKLKLKQEAAATQKSNISTEKSKKENSKKTNIETPKQKEGISFIKNILIGLLITSVILFVLTSVKLDVTQNVERLTTELYGRGLKKLPPNLKSYGIQGGQFIHNLHEKTGNATLSAIKFIHDNVISKDKCDKLIKNLITLFEYIIAKFKNVYNNTSI